MKQHLPLIATLTGFLSFVGIWYMLFHPELPGIIVFIIYMLATCAGICGLYLMSQKKK